MLRHFLIVLDQIAEDVVMHSAGIARVSGARVTLLRLHDQPGGRSRFVDPVEWHMRKIEAEAGLNEMRQHLRKMGLQVRTAILDDRNPEHILQYAQSHGIDLLILAGQTEGVSDLAHDLMRRTPIPILIVRTGGRAAPPACYQKILAPLDGSQRAECVLPLTIRLAQSCDAQILLAHVIGKPQMPRRAPPTTEDAELLERVIESNRNEAIRYLEQTAARLPGAVETRLLVNDSVAAALHDLVDREGVDLVVLSAHGYSAAPQWPYGSIANSLIAYSQAPVLVVQDMPASETANSEAVVRSGRGR